MLPFYQLSETELLICDLYQTIGINYPHELDIELIASLWGADIVYYEGRPHSYWDKFGSLILLNKHDPPEVQRADFFHELGHIARHEGHQDDLPDLYVELQELQSWQFALMSAIPYYLLPTPLDMTWNEYIGLLAEEFRVPIEFAIARTEQILSRFNDEYYLHRKDTELIKNKIDTAEKVYRTRKTLQLLNQSNRQLSFQSR